MSNPQNAVEIAALIHHAAALTLTRALEELVANKVLHAYPDTEILHCHGEYGEDGQIKLRAQRVVDKDGRVLAAYEEPMHTQTWDDLVDAIDPDLDWIAGLNDDDYLNDQELAVLALKVADTGLWGQDLVQIVRLAGEFAAVTAFTPEQDAMLAESMNLVDSDSVLDNILERASRLWDYIKSRTAAPTEGGTT